MKVVIDTNIFLSSLYGGNPKKIIDFWRLGKITLCVTQEILEEYFRVLIRSKLKPKTVQKFMNLIANGVSTEFYVNLPKLNVVRSDPFDNKFFECAVAAKAKMIISGDKKVLAIKKYVVIEVCSVKQFLDKFESTLPLP